MGADPSPRVTDPQPRLVQTSVGGIALTDEGPHGASAILCVHGVPGSSRDWRYLAPLLAPTLRVVRLEMPGFGASPPGADDTIDGWARVTTAVADSLGLERFVLMGHSYGGGGGDPCHRAIAGPRLGAGPDRAYWGEATSGLRRAAGSAQDVRRRHRESRDS